MRRSMILAAMLTLFGATSARAAMTERTGLGARVEVPPAVLEAVQAALPERRAVAQSFLSPVFDSNLLLSQRSSVNVTFLADGASYRNALGYFTYVYDGAGIRIVDRGLVFPNASVAGPRGTLQPGDTAPLRDAQGQVRYFDAGTHLGFFLVSNGWTGSGVAGWNEQAPQLPAVAPAQNANILSTLDQLNPEAAAGKAQLARHVAMVGSPGVAGFLDGRPFLLMGMEDVRRDQGSDEDFNDLVFVIHTSAPTALSSTQVPTYSTTTGDLDGDGVTGLTDAFPNDASRATVQSTTSTTVLPGVSTTTDVVLDGQGNVKDVQGTFHRAAGEGGTTLTLPGLPAEAAHGTVRLERFSSTGGHTGPITLHLSDLAERQVDGTLTVRIPEAFGSEAGAVESTRVVLTFDRAIAPRATFVWHLDGSVLPISPATAAPSAWLREWSIGIAK